jgi:uncharacterized MAPEG superfamily protein
MPIEITLLGWSVALLFAQIALQSITMTRERGSAYNASPRDQEPKLTNVYAGRCERALRNLLETYPAFVGLALALAVSGKTGGMGAWGAGLWFVARIVYIPLYVAGIPYIRSLVWIAAAVGLFMMAVRLLG